MKLSPAILEQFEENGFVVLRGLLDWEGDLQPVVSEYEEVLDRLVSQWLGAGLLESDYKSLPFFERLVQTVCEAKQSHGQHFDISLPQADITEETPMHHGPAVFRLLRSGRLLDVVEQFIGPEIYSNPVQHTRVKLPEAKMPEEVRTGLTGRIDWHQDSGVITADSDTSQILTVWFPLTDATLENGCLAVVPGSHRKGLALHCRSRDPLTFNQVAIPEKLMTGEHVPLPMEPGDVLFMHRRTRHAGMPNLSNRIRWSFDLRYQPIGQPTGRRWFPGFVARSRANPESELRDADAWSRSWCAARHALASGQDVAFNRWKQGDPSCA